MRKRVGLGARDLLRPQIMLYDEPTTGVDPIMGDSINDLIVELHTKLKVTSIAVTHDMTSAYKIADRIAMLYNGKIIADGTPDEIKNTRRSDSQAVHHRRRDRADNRRHRFRASNIGEVLLRHAGGSDQSLNGLEV